MRKLVFASAYTLALLSLPAHAQHHSGQSSSIFAISSDAKLITGDTWEQDGARVRLYGVQSCIRGTSFLNATGTVQDCGDASLAMLAALIRDTRPTCTPIAQLAAAGGNPPTIFAVCAAHIGQNAPDLGTVLITQGFGFAAINNSARPVYAPYLVAELAAKESRAGLWATRFTHPNTILFKAVNASKQ